MNFIKKHKILIVFVLILFIILVLSTIYIYSYKNNKDKYGNRLNGIENVIISNDTVENVKQTVLNNNNCISVSYKLDGKLIKLFIEVKPETDELSLESVFNLVLDQFSESEKAFYDFEIFVTSDSDMYPLIAYKHRNNDIFSITRKEVIENEE